MKKNWFDVAISRRSFMGGVLAAGGGAIGERTAVNYVSCTAYYVRGPEDLKALSEINLATGKGAHP